MSEFLQGVGVACAIFGTGFFLAIGWFAGVKAGAWAFGPHRFEHNYNVNVREPQGDADK